MQSSEYSTVQPQSIHQYLTISNSFVKFVTVFKLCSQLSTADFGRHFKWASSLKFKLDSIHSISIHKDTIISQANY